MTKINDAESQLYETTCELIGSEYTLRLAFQAIHALYDCIMARDHILEPDEQEACTQAEALFEVEKTMKETIK